MEKLLQPQYKVKVIGIDKQGKISLSRKALLNK